MATPHLNLRMSQWLNKLDIEKEKLEPLLHEALAISCERIKENLRNNHPKWDNRTYGLYKAINAMFIGKLNAKVYIDEGILNYYSTKGPDVLDPSKKYKAGQNVGKNKRFPNEPFRNYANYLIEGTQAHSSKYAKALRYVDKYGYIKFVRRPRKVAGIDGDSTWLARARRRVNYRKIIGEVLDRHGIKHD